MTVTGRMLFATVAALAASLAARALHTQVWTTN